MKINRSVLFFVFLNLFVHFSYAQNWHSEKLKYQKSHPQMLTSSQPSGSSVASLLNASFKDTAKGCDSNKLPAFLCTGVMLRGTQYSSSYHAWDPSPSSQSSGGVSFSYLRADSQYNKLAYGYVNGFIFYPYFSAPDGKYTDIDVMCSYPIDAGTENRTNKGCGASNTYPSQSGACQAQGITTAEQWYSHYQQGNGNHSYQCGFTTADDSQYDTADSFYQSILSMAKIYQQSFNEQNELRLATWAQGMQNTLPIEAFFYLKGNSYGLSSAQNDQRDFSASTSKKLWVPVIELTLPQSSGQKATFTYRDSDQAILNK